MNCEIFSSQHQGAARLKNIENINWESVKKSYQLNSLIGLPHWEYEFQHFPKMKTRDIAKKLIDQMGFNLLLGAHPHTLQPMEWFQQGICLYSIGNFCGLGIGTGGLNVTVKTLDSFNYENVGLIKLDVEGFEEFVLRGGEETIGRCKPIIYLEADREEKLSSLANYLSSIGYAFSKHQPPLFSKNNFFNNSINCWDKNYISANWVCRYI